MARKEVSSTTREESVWASGKSHTNLEALSCVKWSSLCVCWCWLWASLCRTDVGKSEVTGPVTSTRTIVVPISVNRIYRRRAHDQQDGGRSVRMTHAISIPMTAVPTSATLPDHQRVAGKSGLTGHVTSMPMTAARISVNRRRRPRRSDDDGAGRSRAPCENREGAGRVYCPFVCTALTRTPTEKIATTEQALRVAFIAAFYFSWGVGDLASQESAVAGRIPRAASR